MKVLQIISSLNTGGAEKLLIESVPIYQTTGVDMDVISLCNKHTLFRDTLSKTTNGKVIGLTNKSVYNPLLIFKLIKYIKHYDIVHVHLFPALYWVVLSKIISFCQTPIIYTEHSTSNRRRNNLLFKIIDKYLIYKNLNKIITIADEVDQNIKNYLGYNTEKFTLINNGVNIDKFIQAENLDKSYFFNDDCYLLIQVSSFRFPKDQKTLIKTMTHLPAHFKLLLVGDGPLRGESEQLVINNNLDDRVKFLGIRNDIPSLLNTADIVILSSEYEGLSLSSIEGMATNPFVCSDAPGLREIVQGYGLLFETGKAEALATCILKLYNSPQFYEEIKKACRRRALEFDIYGMVNNYIKIYKQVIKECQK